MDITTRKQRIGLFVKNLDTETKKILMELLVIDRVNTLERGA